eukprot:240489-Amorphochlora_amoeboformis.AAC.2
MSFTNSQCLDSCAFCFDVLRAKFDSKVSVRDPDLPSGKLYDFDHINTRKSKKESSRTSWRLRGCIGTFEARPLAKGLEDYALISALKDSRFRPMAQKEIPSLAVNTSFLTNFEDGKNCYDWTVRSADMTCHTCLQCQERR